MSLRHRLDGPDHAPVVVLAGSLGTTYELWAPQLPFLDDFRVLRYDHPGHGTSPLLPLGATIADLADEVLLLLDELELEHVSFCGLSLGGAVGMVLAAGRPARIDRLVLACTSARFGPRDPWLERARLVRAEGVEAVAESVVGRWFTAAFAEARPQTVAQFRAMLLETPAEGYARCCEAIAGWDFHSGLARIEAPTLVLAAADDPAAPPAQGEALAEATGGELVVLERAAHIASAEQPERFSRALVRHLQAVRA